tara:strand:- start:1337 stop:1597 length:261 start_codon:yes stop_codon:yes gene_type:complete
MTSDTKFFDDLSKIIIFHRKQSGLNRAELSHLSNVSKTVIYDIEHGKKTVRFENIVKILNVLNIKIKFTSPLMSSYMELLNKNEKS